MEKYEYKEISNKDIVEGKVTLSNLQAEGWELVKIVGLFVYLRRLKNPQYLAYKRAYDD